MRIQDKCLPCIVNQAIKVSDMVGLENKEQLFKKVFAYLSEVDYQVSSTPELIGEIFQLLKQETGNQDPYYQTRNKYNTLFLQRLDKLEKEIDSSDNPFETAIKYAIIGNIIDFNPIHNLSINDIELIIEKNKQKELEINDSNSLIEDIKEAKRVLYLGDNCGEICFDKLLIKKMSKLNPTCHFYFGTRGSAVVNDSIEEDAYKVGIDEFARVISNGDGSLGTVLPRTSQEFKDVYYKADVIIAKGQANYECLSEVKENIYFLLMTKCKVIGDDLGIEEMSLVCKKLNNR